MLKHATRQVFFSHVPETGQDQQPALARRAGSLGKDGVVWTSLEEVGGRKVAAEKGFWF